jgi:hypothetical protein
MLLPRSILPQTQQKCNLFFCLVIRENLFHFLNPGAKMVHENHPPLLQDPDIIVAGKLLFRHYCRKKRATNKCMLIITAR